MRKIGIILLLSCIITLTAVGLFGCRQGGQVSNEYLRIHIRADSDEPQAQAAKYAVRDAVVSYLTPFIAESDTFSKAKTLLTQHLESIERVANGVLEENGFSVFVVEFSDRGFVYTLQQAYIPLRDISLHALCIEARA